MAALITESMMFHTLRLNEYLLKLTRSILLGSNHPTHKPHLPGVTTSFSPRCAKFTTCCGFLHTFFAASRAKIVTRRLKSPLDGALFGENRNEDKRGGIFATDFFSCNEKETKFCPLLPRVKSFSGGIFPFTYLLFSPFSSGAFFAIPVFPELPLSQPVQEEEEDEGGGGGGDAMRLLLGFDPLEAEEKNGGELLLLLLARKVSQLQKFPNPKSEASSLSPSTILVDSSWEIQAFRLFEGLLPPFWPFPKSSPLSLLSPLSRCICLVRREAKKWRRMREEGEKSEIAARGLGNSPRMDTGFHCTSLRLLV